MGPCGPKNYIFGDYFYLKNARKKEEEYMESKITGIFRVTVVAKNILLGSLGTQRQGVFLKKHTNFVNQTVTLTCSPC